MLLAIDIGNSTVSFGIFDGGKLVHTFKAESRRKATADEYFTFLRAQLRQAEIMPDNIDGIVIASVVPPLVHIFFNTLKKLPPVTPLLVSSRLKLPIKIKYRMPESLGADRIASASAFYSAKKAPVAVIDFGTATTVSVVDGEGNFLGGTISPGLLTGYEALTAVAAGLPRTGLAYPKKPVGEDTAEGLEAGVILGHAAMADGLLLRMEGQLGEKLKVAATGGLAEMAAPHMTRKPEIDKDLTLTGLALIHKLNIPK